MNYWPPYVPVSERKNKAAKKIATLKKKGQKVCPVVIDGRTIAKTFWGKSWCTHLESYSDYENRLPRGRTYVRNGSVIDLHVGKGYIYALVCGSSMYNVSIEIQALEQTKWQSIIKECAGKIDSLIELIQGKFSKATMEIITNKERGLFPNPDEIKLNCSCPDHAYMCKHIAAVLYGIGARLDDEPEKLFLLRQVDHFDLINATKSSEKLTSTFAKKDTDMDDESLSSLFGIEIDNANKEKKSFKKLTPKSKKSTPKKPSKPKAKKRTSSKKLPAKASKKSTSKKSKIRLTKQPKKKVKH